MFNPKTNFARSSVPISIINQARNKAPATTPISPATRKVNDTLLAARHSLTDHDTFRQRLAIKKMSVVRASGDLDKNELLKKRLETKIATQSGIAYDTDADKIAQALEAQNKNKN